MSMAWKLQPNTTLVKVSSLSREQAVFLAAILPNPKYYPRPSK